MADTVQYRLERMHPELDDLEKRGLFTKHEILDIVKHRRKFEYRLKRPSPLKRDFLEYIDYEVQLDALRRLRKEEGQTVKKRSDTSVSDFAPVARIVDIYRLAVTRFKGDLDLWFRYLEFCRTRRNGRMKKVLAQVLRYHPKVPGVWIYAAAWEFDQNLNAVAARALMQNGLRVCPNSEDLWVEYLRMELTYLNKLNSRKVALGEQKGGLVKGENDGEVKWKDETEELYMPLEDVKSNNVDDGGESEARFFNEHALNLVKTVYAGAIEAIPHNFTLRQRLLEICEALNLGDSCDIQTEILEDMKSTFGDNPKYWSWLAQKEQSKSEDKVGIENAIKVYEEGIKKVNNSAMFKFYSKFLLENLSLESEEDSGCSLESVISVYERAIKLNCIDEDMMRDCVSLYLKLGRFDEARTVITDLCSGKMMGSLCLCITKVVMDLKGLIKHSFKESAHASSLVFKFLLDVLSRTSLSEAYNLWTLAFKLSSTDQNMTSQLIEMAYKMVAKQGGDDNQYSLPSFILNYVLQKEGIEKAREFYKRFLKLPHPGISLYKTCIEMEESIAFLGDKDSLANVRRLYDSALLVDDQSSEMWNDYYTMELKMGTSETANAVYWRARKVLKNFSAFQISN